MPREDPNLAARRYMRDSYSLNGTDASFGGFVAVFAAVVLAVVVLAVTKGMHGGALVVVRTIGIIVAVAVPIAVYVLLGRRRR